MSVKTDMPPNKSMKATAVKWSGASALALVVALGTSQAASGAVWRNPRTGASFDNDVAAFGKADQTNPPPRNAILFLGASSMRRWKTLAEDLPEYRVINRGFGGSQITDVIHYMDRVVLPYSPAVIVFYPGADDTETVLADFKAFVTNVHSRLATTHIVFMSLLAKPADLAAVDRVRDANRLIKEFAVTQPGLSFIDVFSEMIGPDGQPRPEFFREDGLHTNERGYALWTKLIRKHLAGLEAASSARKGPAETQKKSDRSEQVNVKLGEEFKIKNISGTEVTVSIVERSGKHYIRSKYHHGSRSELRDYAVTNAVKYVSTSDRAISIWFPHTPDAKLAGAVYVINNHGEAVKVDDITMVDLTW
jgi:lysophospholipase L1-like esterase